jgi:hypothetical protein
MIGVFLAVAVMQSTPEWQLSRLDMGWSYLGGAADGTSIMFTRDGPRPSMIWVRTEREVIDAGVASYMKLVELDCQAGRYRVVQSIAYAGPNLEGSGQTYSQLEAWQYPGPGTLGESYFKRGCGFSD